MIVQYARFNSTTTSHTTAITSNGVTSNIIGRSGDSAPDTGLTYAAIVPGHVTSATQYSLFTYLNPATPGNPQPNAWYRTKTDGSLQLLTATTQVMPQLQPENRSLSLTA